MLFTHANIENADTQQDIRVSTTGDNAGIITHIADHIEPEHCEEIIDLHGNLVIPPFVDPHVHLDSTMTVGEPEFNESGTLFDGIRIWSERKKSLTFDDVVTRATAALRLQATHGIQFVRSHVDITDPELTALRALLHVRQQVAPWITLQLVAFPQEGILSFPHGKQLMRQAAELGVDVIGAIPHFEFTREYSVASLNYAFDIAQEYNLLFDAHCDEIDDPASRGLETVATRALETGMRDKVTASHTTAMGSYNDAYTYKLMRLLKMSGINFIANPPVNMYLGGRFDTYPKRRGLTRVKELDAAGINVAFGEDDIRDPWYPLGNGNMMDILHTGLHATQIMGYSQIMQSYRFITRHGARAMHVLDRYGIEVGKPASFLVFNAANWYEAFNTRATMLYSVRNGTILVSQQPTEPRVHF